MTLSIGIYGQNGHQIHGNLVQHPHARLLGVAAFDRAKLPVSLQDDPSIRHYATLDELLSDGEVELVSLCSPRRVDQAADAIRCLNAGKHVYAEKPAAFSEAELDAIVVAAKRNRRRFHEMAGSAVGQPYVGMRKVIESGVLGTIVQVYAQKSYPYFDRRPQDENVDGGLTRQAGVHATRFVEHLTGLKITHVECFESSLGNPFHGPDAGLRMASTMNLRLSNGGLACIVSNYLNQLGLGSWGNETVRIFGTAGMLEAVDGGTRTRLIVGSKDHGPIDTSAPSAEYLDLVIDSIRTGQPMPFSIEDELHPTRVVIRAKLDADKRSR